MKILTLEELKNIKDFYRTIEYQSNPEIDAIIEGVKNSGDNFLIEISNKFNDGVFLSPEDFIVSKDEINDALKSVDAKFIENINFAKTNIENFAKMQLSSLKNLEYKVENSILGHKIVPVNSVLCYVPGGRYPLVSTVLMTVIPALCANVKEIILTSPKIKKEVIAAAALLGVHKIYKLGGAQAISAFGYGTETIAPVDKIVGPGNKYVTYAKKYLYGEVDIDFLAGPSEVMILADKNADPKIAAADMLAQSEHDVDARSYLITNSLEFANEVQKQALAFLEKLETSKIASIAFENSYAVVVEDFNSAIDIINKRAPEHLEIMVKNPDFAIDKIKNYGSLFIGEDCAEVFGDYVSGTNHVLPTNKAARYTGGLSVFDFVKILTYQKIDSEYAKRLSKTASYLAQCEGLFAHKLASDLRG